MNKYFFFLLPTILLISCSSGGGDSSNPTGTDNTNTNCATNCLNQNLSLSDVEKILNQAQDIINRLSLNLTLAITDRSGNVLAVYQTDSANKNATINGQINANGGLENAIVPASLVAISKAGTAAYLSSQGNGFTTRTASQIIQENFNPLESNATGGPLFGVQISQLPCSDLTIKSNSTIGPKSLPLGLSADPGGFPLYKNGDLVGGIGIEIDGIYTLDRNIRDDEDNLEEKVALLSSQGFWAPEEIVAERIFVGGKNLKFSSTKLDTEPSTDLPQYNASNIIPVNLFFDGNIKEGSTFGTVSSGYLSSIRANVATYTLVNSDGSERYPLRDGQNLNGQELKSFEVNAILDSCILTANRARAAIRKPLGSSAKVTIFVVDTRGDVLGFTQSKDAPVFGTDVALQKARTALFFSLENSASMLNNISAGKYLNASQNFFGGSIFSDGRAFTSRAIGNLARPFYPDGINGNINGPLSLSFPSDPNLTPSWSPFNDGLQLDLALSAILEPLISGSVASRCSDNKITRNGIQIFAGSVPLYRNGILIGAIGVSGDGIDQDDLVSFLGASRIGLDFAGHTDIGDPILGFNAPREIRADQMNALIYNSTRLRYVNCPEAPFIDSNEQNVCEN